MRKFSLLTQEELKDIIEYNKDTGIFTWKSKISKKVVIGSVAGYFESRGYWEISIKGIKYKAHRLAWLYVFGEFPLDQIDHINHIRTDNRISNLREATNAQNALNKFAPKNNRSGFKGVHWNSNTGKWRAQCRFLGKNINLGLHDTAKQASDAYAAFISINHGEFAALAKES